MSWTITLGATTKTLAEWGVSSMVRERRNQQADRLLFTLEGFSISDDAPFAVDDVITMKYGTTKWFVGRCKRPVAAASGTNEVLQYEAENVWGELERRYFQQSARQYVGMVADVETYETYYTSHVILFASANVAYDPDLDGKATLGMVIKEVLDYAIAQGASVQYVGAELTALTIIGPARALPDPRCADALREALRWCPDLVVWFDYTTSPATIHFTPRASMSQVSLNLGDAEHGVTNVAVAPRDDLGVPFVYIKFEVRNQLDGKSWISIMPTGVDYDGDLYPTSAYPDGLGEMDGLVLTVDLQGSSATTITGKVDSAALPSGTTPSADWKTWLQGRCPPLTASEVTSYTLDSLSFDGTPLDYELLPGSGGVAEWMRTPAGALAEVADVTVKCRVTLTIQGDIKMTRDLHVRITTTNLPADTYYLQALDEAGEPVPSGLAQYLYTQMNAGHWEGRVVTELAECPGTVRPGHLLNLNYGSPAWEEMDAVVYATTEDIFAGRTTISVGPNRWLNAGEIMGWLKSQRQATMGGGRRAWNTLTTGLSASGIGDVTLPLKQAVDAPTAGGVTTYEKLSLRQLSGGSVDSAKGQILLSRADAADGSSANGKLVKVRQLKCTVKDTSGTQRARLLVVASDAYDSSIHSSELELVAGGTIRAYKVQSEGDNHLSVKLWESGAETGSALNIAKPPYLRLANKPSAGHVISPAYTSAVVYGVEVSGGTDVTVSGSALTVIELNLDARKWAYAVDFCESETSHSALVDMGAIS